MEEVARVTKETVQPAEAQLERELDEMRIALAKAISQWSSLEDMLAILLNNIIGNSAENRQYGITAFFTPTAFELRLKLVSNLIAEYVRNHNQRGLLQDLWKSVHRKIDNARETRNKLAHGTVQAFQRGNDKPRVRLTGSYFKVLESAGSKQLPGMSLHEVQQSITTFEFCCGLVVVYTSLIQLFEHDPSNVQAFNEKAEYVRGYLAKAP